MCFLYFPPRLHARFYELAPNLVPMDYRKSPTVHVPMSLIIQMPELRVCEVPSAEGLGNLHLRMGSRGTRSGLNPGFSYGCVALSRPLDLSVPVSASALYK